ncbi:MAG: galactose-1-phosphate uridylyltransferase [Actinomycetota bacterium]|nr:galactose-1-phosphate uridylyltransferase [Actinomycetota bacterium]
MGGEPWRRTDTTLADGRQLHYYDPPGGPVRDARDERPLSPVRTASELRYDPLLDTWVVVAAHRQERTYRPAREDCPLCPSRPGHPTEIPAEDYHVVVFDNRFPSLSDATATSVAGRAGRAGGLLATRPGVGRCEVVVFTPHHDASFADLTPDAAGLVLAAWTDRTAELSALPSVTQVFCFENRGSEIGVTLDHPHGQIYAFPFVTARTARVLASVRDHARRTGRNLFDDVLAAELHDGRRLVAENDAWTAFVPHAARWPYEVHLYPRRRVPDLLALDDDERALFPPLYLDLLARFDRLFATPAPYIAGWHQAPAGVGHDELALHLELFTIRRADEKLKYLAGTESGMDAFANDIPPEAAAGRLRAVAR